MLIELRGLEYFLNRLLGGRAWRHASQEGIANDFSIEVSRDFDSVQGDWAWLEREGLLTPFQTRSWLTPFYRVLAPRLKATPVFVTIRDRASDRPAMLLLLCARRFFGIPLIQFADLGVSDYNAPLIAKSFNPSLAQWSILWRQVLAALGMGSVLRLKNMPPLIGGRPNPLVACEKSSAPMSVASWKVALPQTIAEYGRLVLKPSFRKRLAKKFRHAAKLGKIEYVVASTREDKLAAFDLLARQRQARCDQMGRANVMTHQAYHDFYKAAVVDSYDPLTSLAVLKIGGEAVGTLLALDDQESFHVISQTFEGGDWENYSLGLIIVHSAIEYCIERGKSFFDLTIGNESYKAHFGTTPSPLYIAWHPLSPTGAL